MSKHELPYAGGAVEQITVHNAITATVAVGSAVKHEVAGAKHVMVEFTEGGTVNNRSGELVLYVSADGVTFTQYNMLIENQANSEAQTLKRVASKTRNAAGTDVLFFTPETLGAVAFIKAAVTLTDGALPTGNFTVKVNVCR